MYGPIMQGVRNNAEINPTKKPPIGEVILDIIPLSFGRQFLGVSVTKPKEPYEKKSFILNNPIIMLNIPAAM